MSAPTLGRLFKREVYGSIWVVMLALLSLFWFFDLVNELGNVGQAQYTLRHALAFTALHLPGRLYELMPVAALIGTVYAMSQMASNSEFVILRSAGMSPRTAMRRLLSIGLVLAAVTFVLGEFIAPRMDEKAEQLVAEAKGKQFEGVLQSGQWIRNIREVDHTVETVNVAVAADGKITHVTLYRFDDASRLLLRVESNGAQYLGDKRWALLDATVIEPGASAVTTRRVPRWEWDAGIQPSVLNVSYVSPEQMTARDLWAYAQHLHRSGQVADRYDLSFWKKLMYPLTVLVMMALALPFAYLHARSGGVSVKVFGGIMLGLSFALLNGLFSQLGLLSSMPMVLVAAAPSLLYLSVAFLALVWVLRVH
ncbi:MAG: LPS export ABC transporter permease LptG [Betaproteobacteria bacterium]|nr:LPS export ABC transporter permease LptG [Betaproteobacteria bacterium]